MAPVLLLRVLLIVLNFLRVFMKKFVLLLSFIFSICAFSKPTPLPVASNVDVARYVGKWYTITSLPQFFTRNCEGQTGEYQVINETTLSVHNVCYKENGKTKDINGKAEIQDAPNNARLVVRFDTFWTRFFRAKGDYNIIKLGEGYDTVMVGSTDRRSLWIMSRETSIDPTTLLEYKTLAKSLGFSTEQLKNSKY
jgi:apolipoprotein D and lipocalin family protein